MGIEPKTALELKEEEEKKRRKEPKFGDYREFLPARLPAEVLAEEQAWFEKTVNELKWLNKAKKELLSKEDYQSIQNKEFIKKSGVKKLALAFGISTEIIDRETFEHQWGEQVESIDVTTKFGNKSIKTSGKGLEVGWTVRARAIRKDGVFCEALAACSNYELAQKKGQDYNPQNILGTAETRATGRAIMNLLGGEVTFEEVQFDEGA